MDDQRQDDTTPEETAEFESMLAEAGVTPPKPIEEPPKAPEVPEPPKPYQPKNEDEAKALSTGIWVPKEEWIAAGKDPDDWVSARRFNLDGKKLRHAQELESRLNEYDRRTKAMLEHIQRQERAKYEAELQRVKAEKYAALQEGDVEKFQRFEEQYERLREKPPEVEKPSEPALPPELVQFRTVIKGVHADLETIEASPEFAEWMHGQPARVYLEWANATTPENHIRILNEYKGRRTQQIPARSPVEPPRPPVAAKPKGVSFNDLTHDQRRTYQEFVTRGMIADSAEERAQFAKDCAREARA